MSLRRARRPAETKPTMKTTTQTFITIQLVAVTTDLRPWSIQVSNLARETNLLFQQAKEELLRHIFREESYGRPLLSAFLASEIDEPRTMNLQQILDWNAAEDDARWQTMRLANLGAERAAFEAQRERTAAGSMG
jgi:hypothetical protein